MPQRAAERKAGRPQDTERSGKHKTLTCCGTRRGDNSFCRWARRSGKPARRPMLAESCGGLWSKTRVVPWRPGPRRSRLRNDTEPRPPGSAFEGILLLLNGPDQQSDGIIVHRCERRRLRINSPHSQPERSALVRIHRGLGNELASVVNSTISLGWLGSPLITSLFVTSKCPLVAMAIARAPCKCIGS